MSNLTTRFVSAALALAVLWVSVYFFQVKGLTILCVLIAAVGIYEMSSLLFRSGFPRFAKLTFFVFGVIQLAVGIPDLIVPLFVILVVGTIVLHKTFSSLDSAFLFISKFMMGLIYAAILPILIISLIKLPHGILWFCCLIAVVFSGDTGAYIAGTFFGKTKVAPLLSPKKSLQGSIGGLFFSSLAGLAFSFIIPGVSPVLMTFLGLCGGFLGQVGDFFESLLKRVAGVKDSGSIMPGHGGVLDRVDGVYFASPLFYIAVYYIIK